MVKITYSSCKGPEFVSNDPQQAAQTICDFSSREIPCTDEHISHIHIIKNKINEDGEGSEERGEDKILRGKGDIAWLPWLFIIEACMGTLENLL